MNFATTVSAVEMWLLALSDRLDNSNATANDGITLRMPRNRDMVVTFRDDPQAQSEQAPAIVVELQGAGWDLPLAGTFKGGIGGSLYLMDEGGHVEEVRKKLSRWVDVLMAHCRDSASIFQNGRVVPRNIQFLMGKTKDLNGFSIRLDFAIQTGF